MNYLRSCISISHILKSLAIYKLPVRYNSISRSQLTKMYLTDVKDAAKRIVWVDLEMTGLEVEKHHIMEISCLVTDAQLNLVATGPEIIIHQPEEILNLMDPWCVSHHGQSGLTEACKNSKTTLQQAENQVLEFIKQHVPKKKCPLGGNSVYMDRLFIRKYMPEFDNYLHYRIIDVSSIKELAKRWCPKQYSRIPTKAFKHRSLDDILDSIEELKYYRQHIFKTEQ